MPGPGNYNPSDYSSGLYITSKFKNRGSIEYKRSVSRRKTSVKMVTPGPGSYNAPSEFGNVELQVTKH